MPRPDPVCLYLTLFGLTRIPRDLARRGWPIGDNDVWIGATALACRMPLVSCDARHFARVPGRLIEEY